MKSLIDAQLPAALCGWLHDRGHSAAHVFDLAMVDASDTKIADYAQANCLILVSKDDDFLTLRLPDRFTFLWLRCGNATNAASRQWLSNRWVVIETLLEGDEPIVEVR